MPLFRCVACAHITDSQRLAPTCERCGSAVVLSAPPPESLHRRQFEDLPPGVWRYGALLPGAAPEEAVSLGEGGTPLLKAERLGAELGVANLMIKDETRNPTGSFLDRGSTVLLSLARRRRVKECVCLTTGNLGASLAAYCAKAGIDARIRVHPSTDRGKLYQMLAYGADVYSSTRPLQGESSGVLPVTAGNPYLLEGEKTTGFEVVQDLGWAAPDVIVVPVGTGGHLSTIWRSIALLREAGLVERSECRLLGVQVKVTQSDPRGGKRPAARGPGAPLLTDLEESVPYFAAEATKAVGDSGGTTVSVTPAQTIESTRLLAATEGIFAEPSSASVVSAVRDAVQRGILGASEKVVCVITGAGLKDTTAVSRLARETRRVSVGEGYALPSPKVGDTKLALLQLLREGPSYGYELWQEIGSRREISTASIYQHLLELEGFSMVRKKGTTVSKGRERVLYELTKRGVDFVTITGKLRASESR
ncbi:MAG: pyridoxal-phosphate dependent enzyme [Nitrososphaerota archaeon]|nr:pyridoxal-phosphate dependent enzyme [Nitrososphaerota archaeon]